MQEITTRPYNLDFIDPGGVSFENSYNSFSLNAMKKKTLTKLSVALIMALGALQANAYQHNGFDTQVDGLIDDDRIKLVGADYINNGPKEFADQLKEMYGDHEWTSGYDANTEGNVVFNLSQATLDKSEFSKAYIYGAGLVYGSISDASSGTSNNNAKVKGNVELNIRDIGSQSAPHKLDGSVWGGGGVGTFTGDATVDGNVTINVSNVYATELEINGGGRADGGDPEFENAPPATASVTGSVTINVENSDFAQGGAIYAGGDSWGENTFANVGSVLVKADNLTFNNSAYDQDLSIIMGGGIAMDQGTSEVSGDVVLDIKNSNPLYVMGGGSTQNDADEDELDGGSRYNGLSAVVKGNVEITLTNSTVQTVIASGNTSGAIFEDGSTPVAGYGEASVAGDVTITLAGNSSVGKVYLAGSGEGSNVKGDSTLVIENSSVTVSEVHGDAFDSQVEGTAKVAFGSEYQGTFAGKLIDIEELEASDGADVTLALNDDNVGDALTVSGAGLFNSDVTLSSGTVTLNGNLNASSLNLSGDSQLVINTGALTTTTDQIFTISLGEDGTATEAGELNGNGQHMTFTGGSIAFNDEFYNSFYANSAAGLIGGGTRLVFNGTLVDVEGDLDIDDVVDDGNTIHSNVDVSIGNDSETVQDGTSTISKDFGASSIKVADGIDKVAIDKDSSITLVGGDEKELISFEGEGEKAITVDGSLQLGDAASNNTSGKLSTAVTVSGDMSVAGGTYEVADVTMTEGSTFNVKDNGQANVDKMTLSGNSTIASDAGHTSVADMIITNGNHTVTGSVEVTNLTGKDDSVMNVGTLGDEDTESRKGSLVIGADSKLNGMGIFLDPAWQDGMTITDASSLVFKKATIDAKIVAGENSYVVFGDSATNDFLSVFGNQVTWGGENGVLAAAYISQAITVSADQGALVVDGSLKAYQAPAAGSVVFGKNSVLVADVSSLTSGEALITADTFNVHSASQAIIVGSMKNGETYRLTDDTEGAWTDDQIKSGNALWGITGNGDGSFTVNLEDAGMIFGDLMQGSELANAGMVANGEANDYVNTLLTDVSGNASLASIAQRFDAAMNVGGALSIFTNAYDRARDFRQIVRSESSMDQEPRLWAHVMGGKTKLDGISSGAQDINTETDHYGIAIGAEGKINNFSLGVALAAGSGDTDNDDVDAKDEFDYYGISVYGRTTVGFVDILGDVSATLLKSDMKMKGIADIDTDTDTTVYSAGIQAQKTLNLGWAELTPFVGMDIYHVRSDGYSAGHGVRVEDSNATAIEFPIGAKIAKSFETAGGMNIKPTFELAVVPTAADRDIDSKVKFAGASSNYNFTFADDIQVRSQLGVEAATDKFRFGLNAGYNWGNEERSDVAIEARMKYLF